MRKTHPYNPTVGLPSLGLSGFRVNRSRRKAPLPIPATAAIPNLSQQAKTGIRVTVEGVVHNALANRSGNVQLSSGMKERSPGIRPRDPHDFARWLNARVQITGVLEVLLDGGGSPTSEIIWAQDATEALLHPMYQRLMSNAVRWCLRLEVADAIPRHAGLPSGD